MQSIIEGFPQFSYVVIVIHTAVAGLIYLTISKKIPLQGLEKHLMKVWLLILIMNVLPTKVMISTNPINAGISSLSVQTNNFGIMLFSLAVALIATSLFAGYKHLKYLGFIYVGISLLFSFAGYPHQAAIL